MTDKKVKEFKFLSHRWYELTIAPSDAYQFLKNGKTPRFKRFRNYWGNEVMDRFDSMAEYYFVIETSMPQSSHKSYPRLHLHGIVRFKDNRAMMDFLIEHYHHLGDKAIIQFNPYRREEWLKYIHKDSHLLLKYGQYLRPYLSNMVIKGKPLKHLKKYTGEGEQTPEVK